MSRKKSREFVLQILYQIDLSDKWDSYKKTITEFFKERITEEPIREFSGYIINGIMKHKAFIDALIDQNTSTSSIESLHYIDRNVLRIALFELFFSELVPIDVAINEAINLAKKYGEQKSGALVNAILDSIKNKNQDKLEYKKDL